MAPQFLEDVLALLGPIASGGWLAPRCTNLALQFVTSALDEKEPYKALKPHIDGLLLHVVLPMLAFSDDDAQLWEDDPAEFVRKVRRPSRAACFVCARNSHLGLLPPGTRGLDPMPTAPHAQPQRHQGYDILEDMYAPRTAAQNLLLVVAQKKRKAHLQPFMTAVASTLSAHDTASREAAAAGRPGAVPPAVARAMDGALLAVGTCADVLKNKSPYREQVEAMLTTFVAPCFDSPHGHLRAKASWVAREFCDFTFSSGNGKSGAGPQFCGLFERVMRSLCDPELPVRVDAVVALRSFVEELADLEILKPLLPSLLNSVFALMSEIDNEDLVFTLESIVEKFGDEIAPYAANLAVQLAEAFWKYTKATEGDDDEDDSDTGAWHALSANAREHSFNVCAIIASRCHSLAHRPLPCCPRSRHGRVWLHPHPERASGLRLNPDGAAARSAGRAVAHHVRDDVDAWPGRVRGGHGHGLLLHLLHDAD